MGRMGFATRIGVAGLVALSLGAAACGDGGTDRSAGAGGDTATSGGATDGAGSDDAGGLGAGTDTCGLLETSEIDAQFGDRGVIGDARLNGTVCSWEVTDASGQVVGSFGLALMGLQPDQSLAEMVTADGTIDMESLEPVADVGDEAYFEGFTLYFRSGGAPFAMMAVLPGVADDVGERDKLVTLAELVVGRL